MMLLLLLFAVAVVLQFTAKGRRNPFGGDELDSRPSKRDTSRFARDRSPSLEKRGGLFFNDSPAPKKRGGEVWARSPELHRVGVIAIKT